jgi:hypothetical protein
MQNEAKVLNSANANANANCGDGYGGIPSSCNSIDMTRESNTLEGASQMELQGLRQQEEMMGGHAPGRKLDGRSAPTGRVSAEFRYKQAKLLEQAAVVRHWEDSLLSGAAEYKQQLLPSRIFYSRARGYPLCVMSVLQYVPEAEQAKMEKNKNVDSQGLAAFNQSVRDWRGNSFMAILQEEDNAIYSEDFLYDPDALDDPELAQGKHRYVLFGSEKTGPLKSSVILYVNDDDLHENLNEQFRERHAQLPHGLTLTKVRKVKKTALVACLNARLEITTVAVACIGFEKLCLMGIVTKSNRRLSMAAVLLLAAKLCEETVCSDGPKKIEAVLEFADREWSISRRQIFAAEFGAFVYLGLSVNFPQAHITLMTNRLLKLVHMNMRSYLGEKALEAYKQSMLDIDEEANAQ